MKQTLAILDEAQRILTQLNEHSSPAFEEFVEQYDDLGERDILAIQVAAAFTSQPVGVAHLYKRLPYTNPEELRDDLRQAAERGWLARVGVGAYQISERGQELFDRARAALNESYAGLEAASDEDMQRLLSLLAVAIGTASQTGVFAEKPALTMGRKLEPQPDAPALNWVRRHMISLLAFRDDAHVAAWTNLEVDGRQMETFSLLWEDEAHTAIELAGRLKEHRGYGEEDYAQALEELATLGWAVEKDGYYELTEEGQSLRRDVEALTDTFFDAAFVLLVDEELAELGDLLQRLARALEAQRLAA